MTSHYAIQYHATVDNEILHVVFFRLVEDVTDPMSDALNPTLEAKDDFIIRINGRETTHHHVEHETYTMDWDEVEPIGVPVEIRTKDKQVANRIWWLANHGTTIYDFQAMQEANEF